MTSCITTSGTMFGALTFDIEPALEKEKEERSSAFKMVGNDPTVDPETADRQAGRQVDRQAATDRWVL